MSEFFDDLTPDRVLHAVERGGFEPTGHCSPLTCLENRVYEIRLEGGQHIVAKFYRPGRWSREAILEEHRFLAELRGGGDPRLRAAAVRGRRDAARDRGDPLRRLASHRRARAGGARRRGAARSWAACSRASTTWARRAAAPHRPRLDAATSAARAAALSRDERLPAARGAGAATARWSSRWPRSTTPGARASPCTASTATATAATCCSGARAGSSSTSTIS